jgi:hypothetical protein
MSAVWTWERIAEAQRLYPELANGDNDALRFFLRSAGSLGDCKYPNSVIADLDDFVAWLESMDARGVSAGELDQIGTTPGFVEPMTVEG